MLNFLKKVFSDQAPAEAKPAAPQPAPAPKPTSPAAAAPGAAKPAPAPAASRPAPQGDGSVVKVQLSDIVAKLPANLAPRAGASVSGAVSVPVQTALSQLSSGSVKIRFAQIREAAPPGTFADDPSLNETMVDLPLQKVLAAINPALLMRRSGQKQMDAPAEITGVFGGKENTGARVVVPSAPAAAPTAAAPAPVPVAPAAAPIPAPAPIIPKPAPVAAAAPVAPIALKPAPAPIAPPSVPAAAKPPTSIVSPPSAPKPPSSSPLPFASQKPATPAPASTPLPFATQKPVTPAPAASPLPFATQKPAAPAPAPAAAAPPSAGGALKIRLSAVSEAWPEAVRQEIAQSNLGGASVSLPMDRVDAAMKTGRVTFKWGEMIKWLDVAFAPSGSPNQDTALELPLKVVAPLFMSQRKASTEQKKLAIGENIPNLFEGLKASVQEQVAPPSAPAPAAAVEAPVAPVAPPAPAPTPAPEPEPLAEAPTFEAESFTSAPTVTTVPVEGLGGLFEQPAKKDWSPQEIVKQLNTKPGVAASLLAMSDGLLVAGELPPPLKSETLAAFLPQMFGRMNHYSGEVHLGPLSTLTMRAGETPCAIFKAGALYLAVLGKPGEPLPDAFLHLVVGELAKRNP